MRAYDVIRKKRDGEELSDEEIRFFIEGYTKGDIPDYQASALCMAIYFRGMNDKETESLTFAVRDSGKKLEFSEIKGIRADKHSTGGVGDKTSLIVAPIVASLGLKVAKLSGRGLGHTGGTIDKLESIPGMSTQLSQKTFLNNVNSIGLSIMGQSEEIALADKKLYSLRDVTATVDSVPLIVSSIMGKKLAADDDIIVLDVKTGSGSFMKTLQQARNLAEIMVKIGKNAGKKITAVISDMSNPLGNNIGNSLEVIEALETLKGRGPEDLLEVCTVLAAEMLSLAGKGNTEECRILAENAISSGKALEKLREMIGAQGGDVRVIEDYSLFGTAENIIEFKSPQSGFISSFDCEKIGIASLTLGAGRNKITDTIDPLAGIILKKKTGDKVEEGETLALMYTSNINTASSAYDIMLDAVNISESKCPTSPLILDYIR